MSEPSESTTDVATYVLRPAPPIKAFFIAAVLIILGAVFTVTSTAQGWHVVVTVLAVIVLIAGVALAAMAVVAMLRSRVKAELRGDGFHIESANGIIDGRWNDITKATRSESGHRITLVMRDDTERHVLSPVGRENPDMAAFTEDLVARLRNRD
ncbi:hypothetical protein [Granulicoccus phenolivorans]|uniref:hypothetical protein n=1 Tax=Granulicoccus phenolivorans TaxID=266854 RepID=UPI00041E8FF8|nr:hypothetical protein [Granulicoccus phenolivorans]